MSLVIHAKICRQPGDPQVLEDDSGAKLINKSIEKSDMVSRIRVVFTDLDW
jgi:hypothetical protein